MIYAFRKSKQEFLANVKHLISSLITMLCSLIEQTFSANNLAEWLLQKKKYFYNTSCVFSWRNRHVCLKKDVFISFVSLLFISFILLDFASIRIRRVALQHESLCCTQIIVLYSNDRVECNKNSLGVILLATRISVFACKKRNSNKHAF